MARRTGAAAALAILIGGSSLLGTGLAGAAPVTTSAPAVADTQVSSGGPSANYGSATKMAVCTACPETGAPTKRAYLRFNVDMGNGPVTSVALRLYATTTGVPRLDARQVSNSWSESTINWLNAPAPGAVVGTTSGGAATGYYDIPIDPAAVPADGTYSFVVSTDVSGALVRLATKEAGAATQPLLVVTTDDGSPPPPPPPPPPDGGPLSAVPDVTASPNYPFGALGRVWGMAEANGRIYIGGDFRIVGGQTRNFLAAINSTTGALDPTWNPNANGVVEALRLGPDGSVYVGGVFSTVGGAARSRLARLDPVTGVALPWNPGASAEVRALAVSGGRVFAGGTFSSVGGLPRLGLAAIDATSGAVITTWTVSTDTSVRDLEASPDGTVLYIGGNFDTIGGLPRRFVGAVSTLTGAVTSWAPTVPYRVFDISVSTDGTRLYTAGGGPFNNGGNQLGAYDTTRSGVPLWDTQADGDWQAVEVRGTVVYGGGHFNMVAGQRRDHLVALDTTTGAVMSSWNPGADSIWGVFALRRGSGTLLVGGDFGHIGGRTQPHFARFSPTT